VKDRYYKEKREKERNCLDKNTAQLPLYQRVLSFLSRGGFSFFPYLLIFERSLSHSVCFRRLYFSFPLVVDLPLSLSPVGLIPFARRHQSGFQKRIHSIGAAVVHSVVPIFLRSCHPPPLFSFALVYLVLFTLSRSFLFVSRRHTWCSPLLGNLTSLGLARDLPTPSIIESKLKESSLPKKITRYISLRKQIAANFLEILNITPNF